MPIVMGFTGTTLDPLAPPFPQFGGGVAKTSTVHRSLSRPIAYLFVLLATAKMPVLQCVVELSKGTVFDPYSSRALNQKLVWRWAHRWRIISISGHCEGRVGLSDSTSYSIVSRLPKIRRSNSSIIFQHYHFQTIFPFPKIET